MRFLFILAFVFLISSKVSHGEKIPQKLITWNVGQGSWSTLVTDKLCHHFDMGGEVSPLKFVTQYCRRKKNYLHISHLDWDHFSFIRSAQRKLKGLCIATSPRPHKRKSKYIKDLSHCSPTKHPMLEIDLIFSSNSNKLSENESSRVWSINKRLLITGDSTKEIEKTWVHNVKSKGTLSILLLGHHGSKTSTSDYLLETLPKLKQGITSARKRKYGHPHPSVLKRLKKHGIANITTEDWGNILLQL